MSASIPSLCLLLFLVLPGCTPSLPNVRALTAEATTSTPQIVGPHGTLSTRQSAALLSRAQHAATPGDPLQRNIALMESLSGHPLTSGNSATLLVDGPATYAAMIKAIETAKDHVNFETFIMSDDEIGRQFADLLIRKQQQGAQVNLIYDAVGSMNTPAAFFQRLRDNGINVLEFNPINPLTARKELRVTQRDHRKVVIVDGKVAFAGGVNISDVYSSSSSSLSGSRGESGEGWRDTHIQIEGPAVAQVQKLFLETWVHQKAPPLPERQYFPHLEAKGKSLVEVIGSYPGEKHRLTYVMYVSAIDGAQRSIHLTTPYFVPDHQLKEALTDAATRGVDVKIVVPSLSDSSLALNAGRSHYEDLLESGVKVYERQERMLHAKTAIVDGVWSTIGSTNMDLWSFLRNNEINVIVLGTRFADQLEQLFNAELAESNEILIEEWEHRPLLNRLKEIFARLLSHWL
jgi:cardiolipin synthase A/B